MGGEPQHENCTSIGAAGVGRDEETGVASQGESREGAISMLDEAVALHRDEAGESIDTPEEERELLENLGIDPEAVETAREDADDVPGFVE